jgi:hypothetical protein
MPGLVQKSSDVRFREIDLSATIRAQSTSTAAVGFVSRKGRNTPFRVTNAQDFIAEYDIPDAAISFGHYAALNFLEDGQDLWALRVVGADALLSSAFVFDSGLGVTTAQSVTAGLSIDDIPENIDWDSYVSGAQIPLMIFWPKSGPGSWANNLAIRIRSDNIDTPTNLAVTSQNTGGSLANGTYSYRVSALSKVGETLATAVTQVIIGGPTTTARSILTWDLVEGAVGYNVYGRTGTQQFIATVGATTNTYTDTGTVSPDPTKLPITSPTGLPTPTAQFDVEVYDLTVNTSTPIEVWTCTLEDFTDDTGQQLEVTQRINGFSDIISCDSYVPQLTTIPVVKTTARVNLAGGDSGTAPTNGAIGLAMEAEFGDPEKRQVNIFINGGIYDVAYQQKLTQIAAGRGDATAILDMPPQYQDFQDSIDFRNLTLNIDSNYAAIYGPDLFYSDPYNGKKLYVPPSGFIAGIYARTDAVAGPQFSPAGLNRGLLNVLGLRKEYNEAQRTLLFQAQVNYSRKFVGSGISVFEATTLQSKTSALSFVSVRRMVNVIKVSVKQFLMFSLHEPNDDFTRRQIVQSVSEFLQFWKDARGILDFQVISDDTNNPTSAYNLGILKVTVFITPIIPVHEIQVDMVITKSGVSFSEINIANLQ